MIPNRFPFLMVLRGLFWLLFLLLSGSSKPCISIISIYIYNYIYMDVSKNRGGPPKSSILIGFSIIFTIHFGGFPLIFGGPSIYVHYWISEVSFQLTQSGCLPITYP